MRDRRTNKRKMARGGFRQPSIYSRTEVDVVKKDYKRSFLTVLLIILFAGAGYLLLFSSLFRIKTVELSDIKYQDKAGLEKTINDYQNSFFIHQNLLVFSKGALKKRLEALPGIRSVKIIKKYPTGLIVQVEERAPAFVWQVLDHKYLVDESGMIWALYDERFADAPIVFDNKNIPTDIGKKPVPATFSRFVMELKKDFKNVTGAGYIKMDVVDTTDEIKVQSDSSWYAYFDTTRTAKNELVNLKRILDEAATTKNPRYLQYIDLRIENKIFYK